ncbi:TonB-dependent receptor domain-containing protein [Aliikangiella sp. IMCC44632]
MRIHDAKNPIAKAVKLALLATATVSALSTPATLLAAEAEEEADKDTNRVVITGSRLRREGFESPSPVNVITAEQIERSGAVALGDVLATFPQLDSTFTSQNSGNFIGTAGIGSLDLRGLGTQRTLVLVNGRRHVSGSPGSSAVDVNSIPAILIERVDIITGANAAVYGADAVTGVVNFILKDNIEGSEVRANYGIAGDSGFERRGVSFTSGSNFAENKGSVIFAFSYDKQDELTAAERGGVFTQKWGTINNPADGDTISNGVQVDDGIPDRITVPNQGHYTISDGGAIFGGGVIGQFNPDGSFTSFDPSADFEYVDGIRCAGAGCRPLDLSTFNDLQVGFERFTLDANFKYNLTDETELFVETRFASVQSNQQGQPSFDFGTLTIQSDNAYISPEVAALTGGADFGLRRFHTDFGRRKELNDRNTFRMVVGARGFIGIDWEWEAFANYGRTDIQRSNFNNRIDERFYASADAVRLTQADVDLINATGAGFDEFQDVQAGDVTCRALLQEATGGSSGLSPYAYTGCVPVNLFGFGAPSQEAIDWFSQTAIGQFDLEQTQVQAFVANQDLFNTWAGPAGFIFGAEFRDERAGGEEDTASALGLTFFNALSVSRGNYQTSEFFTEMSIPLLNGVMLVEDLTVEVAARSSDYSTIGKNTTWEGRLNWEVNSDLTIRYTTGESLRAPDIGELFSPPGQNFFGINDPCDMDQLANAANGIDNRIANCQALGIADPENFVANDSVTVPGSSGGNPNLVGEESTTSTIGFVYSPSFLEGFNIAVDMYDFEITKAIANTGAQAILNRCVDDPNGINNQFCALNDRDPATGDVSFIRSSPVNLNEFQSKGIDFEMDYKFDLADSGVLTARLAGSYLQERTFILNTADNTDSVEGEVGSPELQYRLSLNWEIDDLTVFGSVTFIDEQLNGEKESIFDADDPNLDASDNLFLESKYYLNLGAKYNVMEDMSVQLLINNATDELPPHPFFGTGTGSAIYDNIGTFYSMNLEYRF